ncbi:WNT1 inducible signaling pathway protein 2 [Pitangus sulphuratus]|nr:WNT1 inducible signaling pathway protein 2 [Pitangus sulphuratus]
MRLQLEKQLLFLSLLCILSKVNSCGHIPGRQLAEQAKDCSAQSCQIEDDEEGCEVNGRVYRDGEVFQPSCKLQCRCLDGGFTCIPLCQEDVRLPTPDCPYPRRVEIPGKCCPEWICEAHDQHLLRDARAAPRPVSPVLPYPCQEWGTEWSACSATCGVGFATRVSNQNRYCRLETQRRLCMLRPCPALPAAFPAEHPGTHTEGKRRSFVAVPTLVSSRSQRLIPAKSLAQTYGIVVLVKMEKLEKFPSGN